jgi:hypothetical protein
MKVPAGYKRGEKAAGNTLIANKQCRGLQSGSHTQSEQMKIKN